MIGHLRRDLKQGVYLFPAYTDEHEFTTEHNRQDVKENIYRHAFSSILFLFSISGGHKLSV